MRAKGRPVLHEVMTSPVALVGGLDVLPSIETRVTDLADVTFYPIHTQVREPSRVEWHPASAEGVPAPGP